MTEALCADRGAPTEPDAPPAEARIRSRWRAREYRRSVKAFVRADGDLAWLAKKTKVDLADLEGLLDGKFHWVSSAAARALEARVRVPVAVEYELVFGTIPMWVVRPYLDEIIADHGAIRAGDALGVDPRRVFTLRGQTSVRPETAERIVFAATGGPTPLYDDPALRRFWFASLPGDTLRVRQQKMFRQKAARQAARVLVAA